MLLKIGLKGDEVKKLQQKLGIKNDGFFGAATEKAVKNWQAANGLKADGVIGVKTWEKLYPDAVNEDASTANIDTKTVDGVLLDKLIAHVPAKVISQVPDCAAKFNINTALRLAHFLAQCAHESAEFKATEENLNYSTGGLRRIFSKYFPNNLADSYARQPEKIASRVYGNRMGNGDETSKEGYKYRGRGYIQLTGKDNYNAFDKAVDEDILSNPDVVSKKYSLLSAAWFWESKSLNQLADEGKSNSVVTKITKRINGGTNGLDDRIRHFNNYYALVT